MNSRDHNPRSRLSLLRRSIRLFLLLGALAIVPVLVSGQNITEVEYFFNSDPGHGNGTSVSVTPTTHLDSLPLSISIAGLPQGFHRLFVRVKNDSGSWSHPTWRLFYKLVSSQPANTLSKLEYFFDNDPGLGNGTAVAFTHSSNDDSMAFAIDLTSLSPGFHSLYARAQAITGKWSHTTQRSFYKLDVIASLPDVVAAEYFFDTDPGYGNGFSIPIQATTNTGLVSHTIDITAMSSGFHSIHVRVKDAFGRWSMVQSGSFYKLVIPPTASDLVAAEYFMDTDPGYGLGIPLTVNPGVVDDSISAVIDISGLNPGFHSIHVRVKNAEGRWSQNQIRAFYRMPIADTLNNIVAAEYFLDADPGYGQGTPVSINPATSINIGLNIDITAIPDGFHGIFARVKDATGKWSQNSYRFFYKESKTAVLPDIERVEYFIDNDPGLGMGIAIPITQDTTDISLNILIPIDSLSEGFHKLMVRARDNEGKWSMTHYRPFYKQSVYPSLPQIVEVEYFFDTDPGEGQGIPVPVATPTAHIPFLAWPLDYTGLNFGEHQIYVRVKDEYGRWSLYARDTIFHYIDTLPTASLSGPVGVCIHDTASFLVYMTGTGPWTLSYFDGFTNHTVSGIPQAYYSFNVIPDSAGHFTARILQVSDVYYTGLYTGIPIEYDVFPFPEAAQAIIGPTDLCASAATAYFSITSVANTDVYHWTVPPGATIVSTGYHWWSGPWIYVDFHGTPQSGTITVTPQNACGSGTSSSLNVTVHPNPVVDAGMDQVVDYGDTAQVSATAFGGAPPYTYSWSPWWAFGDYTAAATSVFLGGTSTVSVTISDQYGCQASDNVTIYVGPQDGATISGFLTYDNTASSPVPATNVYLKQMAPVDTALTGSAGDFSFVDVSTGWYTLGATSARPWGGVNATDGLLIMKHFVDSLTLQGLRYGAADVNASGYVNAVDALMCSRRFTGLDTSFASGDWLFENPTFYTIGIGTGTVNFKGICFGDVDASFIPGKQSLASVELLETGSLKAGSNRMAIPVLLGKAGEIGAASLVLHVPAGFRVENVRMAAGDQGNLVFNLRGDELRIAWFSMDPLRLKAGDPLLFIDASWMILPHTSWRIGSESSLADGDARTIDASQLNIPKLVDAEPQFALGYNYPNPFRGQTVIPYTLPSAGKVKISLLNLLGEVVTEIYEGDQEAGSHETMFNTGNIAPGVYHYRLVVHLTRHRYEQSRTLVIAH